MLGDVRTLRPSEPEPVDAGKDGERPFALWLEFEHWVPKDDDDPEDNFFNMSITLRDGRRYGLNVWTYKFVSRAVRECRETGENLNGAYMEAPDLLIERLDRSLVERAAADLIARQRLRVEWETNPGDNEAWSANGDTWIISK